MNCKPLVLLFSIGLASSLPYSALAMPAPPTEDVRAAVLSGSSAFQVRDILAFAMDPDGGLDRELHRVFWTNVRQVVGPDPDGAALKRFRVAFRQHADDFFTYHRETWRSAHLSRKAGKVVRTPALSEMDLAMKGDESFASMTQETNKILRAAAAGTPYDVHGIRVDIDEKLIAHVLNSIDRSIQRVENLLDPAWKAGE